LCNTDADCVGNANGPTCTPCPACGKHCWGGGGGGGGGADAGTCADGGTKCVCIYGNCSYDWDCPASTACSAGKCKDGGTESPPQFNTGLSAVDMMGIPYAVTSAGKQALSSSDRTTHMELSGSAVWPSQVNYPSCGPAGRCFWVGEQSKCSRDGGVPDRRCCA